MWSVPRRTRTEEEARAEAEDAACGDGSGSPEGSARLLLRQVGGAATPEPATDGQDAWNRKQQPQPAAAVGLDRGRARSVDARGGRWQRRLLDGVGGPVAAAVGGRVDALPRADVDRAVGVQRRQADRHRVVESVEVEVGTAAHRAAEPECAESFASGGLTLPLTKGNDDGARVRLDLDAESGGADVGLDEDVVGGTAAELLVLANRGDDEGGSPVRDLALRVDLVVHLFGAKPRGPGTTRGHDELGAVAGLDLDAADDGIVGARQGQGARLEHALVGLAPGLEGRLQIRSPEGKHDRVGRHAYSGVGPRPVAG